MDVTLATNSVADSVTALSLTLSASPRDVFEPDAYESEDQPGRVINTPSSMFYHDQEPGQAQPEKTYPSLAPA